MLMTNYAEWIGRSRTLHGGVDVSLAKMLHATLVSDENHTPRMHQVLPYLWHWAGFAPMSPMAELSEDGHPKRGDFLPPVNLPRRMWAGGSVSFHGDLHVGEQLQQVSTIQDVSVKSEKMVFVTVEHAIYQGGRPAVTENQSIVYLEIPDAYSPPRAKPVPERNIAFETDVPLSEAFLFRYSAATFNAHRIHYDRSYALDVEKYPGLVVHGPLQATLLLNAAVAHTGRRPATFRYRGVHPMFDFHPMHLIGFDASDTELSLCTAVPGQHRGMEATVIWEDTAQ